MKARYDILFVVGSILVATVSTSAVPAKPVDATQATLLPANGTPDKLRKMVADFDKRIAEINVAAETKREQLQQQMKDGLEKAIIKAQSSGDIEVVLALKAAKEQFETLTTSDVPLVKNAIEFREKKTKEIETARVADAMQAAKELNDELEKTKKDETVKGNFDRAKAIAEHQEKLVAWVRTLRSSAPQPTIAPSKPAQPAQTARPPQPVVPPGTQTDRFVYQNANKVTETKTIVVSATKPDGAVIATVKEGDTMVFKYLRGRWKAGSASWWPMVKPDSEDLGYDQNAAVIFKDGRWKRLETLPPNTASTPFEYVVPEDGTYRIRINDVDRSAFADNSGVVQYEVKIIPAGSR